MRVMGLKEETVEGIGFRRLAIFRPGIIADNAHTPRYIAWLGRLICRGRFGTIEQDDIGCAFVAEFVGNSVCQTGLCLFFGNSGDGTAEEIVVRLNGVSSTIV